MQGRATLAAIVGSPRGLAVYGDDVGQFVAQALHPAGEAGLKELRIQRVDDVVEGVVRGKTALERVKTP